MTDQASCLIKTRMYHIGFPEKFQYFPSDMKPDTVDKLHEIALEVMRYPNEIASPDHLERCVIVLDDYLVLGVAGFLKDLIPKLAAEYSDFCDASNTRKVYGFFAFVWNRKTASELPKMFPGSQEFADLVIEMLLPHWRKLDHSRDGELMCSGIKTEYRFSLAEEAGKGLSSNALQMNTNHGRCEVRYTSGSLETELSAVLPTLRPDSCVSVRTGSDTLRDVETLFDNWIIPGAKDQEKALTIQRKGVRKVSEKASKKMSEPQMGREPTPDVEWSTEKRTQLGNKKKEPAWGKVESAREQPDVPCQVFLTFFLQDDYTWEEMDSFAAFIHNYLNGEPRKHTVDESTLEIIEEFPDGRWKPGMEEQLVRDILSAIASKQKRGMFTFINSEELLCEIISEQESISIQAIEEGFKKQWRALMQFFNPQGQNEEHDRSSIMPPDLPEKTGKPELEKKVIQKDTWSNTTNDPARKTTKNPFDL